MNHNRVTILLALAALCVLQAVVLARRSLYADKPASTTANPAASPSRSGREQMVQLPPVASEHGARRVPPPATTTVVGAPRIDGAASTRSGELSKADTISASSTLVIPRELQFDQQFAQQLRHLRDMGGDTWILGHMAQTQFYRQWSIWVRSHKATVYSARAGEVNDLLKHEYRDAVLDRQVSDLLGPEAVNRIKFKDWIRRESSLTTGDASLESIKDVYRAYQEYALVIADLQRQLEAGIISRDEYDGRYRDAAAALAEKEAVIMKKETRAP